ncbi:DsbE family thiol:disulfide interchange protein [Ottowia sp.]|uniref:DsbE family thiol:disulfide interchange protein n=1 Tax=Ottowia sp. TaxID=1898956 RepID=UPI002B98728A|nr:DsbE family thiol:disulfide interchange protein [Ottowia sp.]HRN76350.1 DsbE family thiol:disulfide interchange protein [Ottowia sp.]HRQ01853.1 DsbE family thiol:disulfide interchange protein [Ottowia sp.]
MRKLKFFLPLLVFLVVALFLAVGLRLNPREVPSPLVDRAAPDVRAATLHDPARQLGTQDLRGQVWVLNVWASWCVACRVEHPTLVQWAQTGNVKLYGLNYKDKRDNGLKWLSDHGNPYLESIHDESGRLGIEFGVYGVPETYVIDRAGVVRYKHTGPVTPLVLQNEVMPLLRKLQGT